MSRPRVSSVTVVPRIRAQRSIQPAPTIDTLMNKPADPRPYYGRTLPDEGIGRIPCIGLDRGAWNGAAPGDNTR